MAKLLIIDTYGLIFRAYHAYPMLTTADGRPTNAIFGFLQMLFSSIEKNNPDYIACSLESESPTFRHELAEEYKANRKEADNELKVQIGDIIDVINMLGIRTLQRNGFEADDVIGSYATQNQDKFDEIRIITGDRDLLQLLSEKIHILMPGKTFSDFVEYDRSKFEDKFEIRLEDYVLYKSLIGDSSDNIKGIPGVGPKTAVKIVEKYHSIDSILANLDDLPPRIAASITEYQELWRKFLTLCKIDTEIDLQIPIEDLSVKKLQIGKLRHIIEKYEFTTLQKRAGKFIDEFEKRYGSFGLFDDVFDTPEDKKTELSYSLVEKVDYELLDPSGMVYPTTLAFVIQTSSGLRIGNGKDFVEVDDEDLFNYVQLNHLRNFVGFDMKPFIKKLLKNGVERLEQYTFHDLKLYWYLLKSDVILDSLNQLVKQTDEDDYRVLYELTETKLKDEEMVELSSMEREFQKVLAKMEFNGVKANGEFLKELEAKYTEKLNQIKEQMFESVGHQFNPASTRDLGHILFDVLQLPVQKKNKTGYSTDDSTLTKLEGMHDIIPLIKSFRQYSKTLSTYVIGLQNFIEPDGKIHTTYKQDQVATGRLSSINPNMQNLPGGDEISSAVRKAFTPSVDGSVFVSFDYSQIDLRTLAYETKDTELNRAFANDEDIHLATARIIFEKEDITKEERGFAKVINFGIVYGMEPYGLSQALKIDQKTAKEFIEKYLEKFNGVKKYFDRITKQLDEKGYVNTFMGRKRYFPYWKNSSGFQKKILFREAINMPIQGGSSEIIKIAMNKIDSYLEEQKSSWKMLLQIHDELIFEAPLDEQYEKTKSDIQNIMCDAYDIGIPLKVSSKTGRDLTFVSE